MPAESNPTILIIEDHQDIAEMVVDYMQHKGFEVDYAADGITGLHLAVTNPYDAIVLDLMLPGLDGLEVCKKVRSEAKNDTPIIMLTARDTLDDKITGLESGADDYLVKPFAIQELEVRVRTLIRRYKGQIAKEVLEIADLSLDTSTLTVTRNKQTLNLTPIALKILTILMRASPAVVSRNELERQVWGHVLPDSDTLRSHLYNLRKTIDKPFSCQLLQTLQGNGYKITDPNG